VNHNIKETPSSFPENWRELDQPFYSLVGDIIDGKGATEIVSPDSLSPDTDFWTEGNPEEIIIATGSTRKALMMSVVLNNIDLPFDHPMDFQEFTVNTLFNGDGSLKEKTFLGEFHGVPVYAESAAAGETAGNSPKAEAINKAFFLSDDPRYDGRNVLIVSTDTVDFLDKDGNGNISNGEEGLGKPMNHPDYPKQNKLMGSRSKSIRSLGQAIFNWQESVFAKKYTKENFLLGKNLVHTNGLAVLELLADGSDEVVRVWSAILQSELDEEFFAQYEPVPDQGGGGASQKNQNWESVEEMFLSLDEETQEILRPVLEEDPSFFKFLVIFQISGMPVMNILTEIEKWAENKKQGLSNKEVVVFAGKES
jgi:hypothetical protein